ncbi:MAG: phosphate ABC transporter permease subunit PstC [Zestosphaera tikiterensis]|uniref:Phosphate transport system permease protein n=1 Tax=Zestosphaera tikiterensis TaxID=1973259 RepID=A0A2R7Y2M0_9CREN|nr:MAG: phosphate ABC transporter permease subunit PstC [Zestosphaera tikiterensis]
MFFKSKPDKILFISLLPFSLTSLALIVYIALTLGWEAREAFLRFGVKLFTENVWRVSEIPEYESYGLLSPLVGSIYVSITSVLIALPLSISLAFTSAEFLPKNLSKIVSHLTDVMGGVPTVIYGLWGSLFLAPVLRDVFMIPLNRYLWFIPLFSCTPLTGHSILTASVVLAVASVPYMTSLVREGLAMIPFKYKEALYSIGAMRYEYFKVLTGMLKPYIVAATLLGFSRVLGETTIVALTIGNSLKISLCVFEPGSTIPSLIANQFESAGLYKYALPTLFAGSLVLLLICLTLTYVGIQITYKWRESML